MMRRSAGGNMIRAVGRAVGAGTAGVKESLAAAGGVRQRARRAVTVSATSSPPSPTYASYSATAGRGAFGWEDWEAVGEEEGFEEAFGVSERVVFGQPPSKEEAEEAFSTLQQIFVPVTFSQVTEDGYPPLDKDAADGGVMAADSVQTSFSTESETDWTEPAVHLYSTQTLQSQERENVVNAFRFLQVNPSMKRMVVSLSSDKAVWDAVMNNEVVQELKKSFYEAENGKPPISEEHPDVATSILKWIFDNTKAKVMNFFTMITKLVNELFNSQEKDGNTETFDVALRSSFMLSVVVLIIVVVTRIQKG